MKKYMVFIISLVCILALAGCGSEAAQEDLKQTDEVELQVWVDYLYGKEMPWNRESDLNVAEFPNVIFRWTPDKVIAIEGGKEKTLFEGMPIWNVFLTDLNSDGLPEFCATISIGSGIIDNRIIVYDYASQELYELSDRGKFDYSLTMQGGQLIVTKSTYNANYSGSEAATGTLSLNTTEENPNTATLSMEIH